jgi:hypothetical protein
MGADVPVRGYNERELECLEIAEYGEPGTICLGIGCMADDDCPQGNTGMQPGRSELISNPEGLNK